MAFIGCWRCERSWALSSMDFLSLLDDHNRKRGDSNPLMLLDDGVELSQSTARGFEPLRAEPNGFLVHLVGHSDTLSHAYGRD
eukprot:4577052-Amphidinium_carterae.1